MSRVCSPIGVYLGHMMIMGIDVVSCGWLCSPICIFYRDMHVARIEITECDESIFVVK